MKNPLDAKPTLDHVLIRKDKPDPQSKSSTIIIPDTVGADSNKGTVIATGPGKRNKKGELLPMAVKAGDRVLLNNRNGQGAWKGTDGHEYWFICEGELLATIEKE